MKKLSKILAVISTAALTFCMWGIQIHAKVVTNDKGVPTHIEADDELEFLDNLTEVLNYINSRLESKDQHKIDRIHQYYADWKDTTGNITAQPPAYYHQKEKKKYRFVLHANQMTNRYAIIYLYQLLCKSTIKGAKLPGVWQLCVNYYTYTDSSYRNDDIIFQLPYDTSTYCVCNHRWHMVSPHYHYVTPTKVTESFKEEINWHNISSVTLGIVPQNTKTKKAAKAKLYSANHLQGMLDTDITKLIVVSTLDGVDDDTLLEYLDHSNSITDFAKFKKSEAISQKLTPKPLAKK